MKFFNLKSSSKWFVTWLSVLTFVISPVASGLEAQAVSAAQVKSALEQMGLNKKITVGEFYQNTKNLYPERIRSQIEPVLMNFKNTMMPEFTVSSVKATDGHEVPNIRMSYNGQLLNFQWFGEKEKFIKFQNTNLSEIDLINFNDMFTKVMAADETLRKQVETKPAATGAKAAGFQYPTITQELWKSMTPQDRANYMINLRLLWSDARQVLNEVDKTKTGKAKKTSSLEKLDLLWKNLIMQDADAAGVTKRTKPQASKVRVVKPTVQVSDGKECLVAGYVTSYNSQYCDHKNIKAEYNNIEDVKKATAECGETKLACNPIVFGTPGGKAICIEPKLTNAQFQIATHYNGPCETINSTGNNHLGSEVHFLKDETKQAGRYSADNITVTDIKAEVAKEQSANGYKATEDFLNGLLKFRGAKDNLFAAGSSIDQSTLEQIIQIKNQFETDIAQATASCKASSNEGSHKDKNFWKACDQLQRRFLFVEEYLQTKCPSGSKINGENFKCACGSDGKKTEVLPGEKVCKPQETITPPPPDAVKPKPEPTPDKSEKPEPCPNGKPRKQLVGITTGARQDLDCEVDKKTPEKDTGSGVWDFMKKLAPIAIGGVALFAMYKLFSPKKPNLNPAGDVCPNGLKPPCGQTCPVPQAMVNGSCGCPVCAPGQTSDAVSCMCSSAPVTPVTPYVTCPDGFTKVSNLSACPVTNYSCWDGTKVANPLNCPEKPPTIIQKTSQ